MTPDPADVLRFFGQVQQRLRAGEREYRDCPADQRPPRELLDEVQQELLDAAAWSFLLWCRLQRLHGPIDRLTEDRTR